MQVFHRAGQTGGRKGETSVQPVCMKIIYQIGQICLQIAVHSYVSTQLSIYPQLFWYHNLYIFIYSDKITAILLVLLMKTSNYHYQ